MKLISENIAFFIYFKKNVIFYSIVKHRNSFLPIKLIFYLMIVAIDFQKNVIQHLDERKE
jgi:hypothetical protein